MDLPEVNKFVAFLAPVQSADPFDPWVRMVFTFRLPALPPSCGQIVQNFAAVLGCENAG